MSLKSSLDELFLDSEIYTLKLALKYHLFSGKNEGLEFHFFKFTLKKIKNIDLSIGTYLLNTNMEIYKINQTFPIEDKDSTSGIFSPIIKEITAWINYFPKREILSTSEFILIHKIPNQVFN